MVNSKVKFTAASAIAVMTVAGLAWLARANDQKGKSSIGEVQRLSLLSPSIPDSVEELVDGAEVVVVGTMGEPVATAVIIHPTQTTDPTPEATPENVPDRSEAVTDFEFTPSDVLLSDGDVIAYSPITIRWNGHKSEIPLGMTTTVGWPQPERMYLLVLHHNDNEPGDTYSPSYGLYVTLLVDGDEVLYADENVVEYAEGATPTEFIEEVRSAVE